jgi:hypothetical protein
VCERSDGCGVNTVACTTSVYDGMDWLCMVSSKFHRSPRSLMRYVLNGKRATSKQYEEGQLFSTVKGAWLKQGTGSDLLLACKGGN